MSALPGAEGAGEVQERAAGQEEEGGGAGGGGQSALSHQKYLKGESSKISGVCCYLSFESSL